MITSNVEVRRVEVEDRIPLQRMLELYQYDLSDHYPQELDAFGEYGYELNRFWNDPTCHAFVVLVNGFYAGFALADTRVKIASVGHWMDQFFILKKHRGSGVGSTLATKVFSALHGHWEIGQVPSNLQAQAFWRSVVNEYTKGFYNEQTVSQGKSHWVVQAFDCGAHS